MEESKFDRWAAADIAGVLETEFMELTRQMDALRRSPNDEMEGVLHQMLMHLAASVEAVQALRRKVANDKRIE
jgi:hypothetical protein